MAHNPVMNNNPYFRAGGSAQATRPNTNYFDQASMQAQAQQAQQASMNDYRYEGAFVPAAERMTYDDAMVKTVILLAITVVSGTLAAMFVPITAVSAVAVVTSLVALGIAFMAGFRPMVSPGLAISYAVIEGISLGSITGALDTIYPGIAFQAVLGTLIVAGVAAGLHFSGAVRTSPKGRKVMLVVMVAALIYSLVNMVLVLTGANSSFRGLDTSVTIGGIPLGVVLGLLMIVVAGYMLISDLEDVRYAVENGAPAIFSWTVAFGICATVMWIYVEVLRVLSIFASRD